MSRYINPYTDFGFKRLFGEEANRELLIDFLNSLLPERHQIKMLEFRNVEQHGTIVLDRKAIFDIYCEAENGERFIVEMQKAKQKWFKDRALFSVTFPIRDQALRGEWDFQLQAIYFVAVLDFLYDEEEEAQMFHRDVTLKDQDGHLFYDKLHFHFLQMPLFTKAESELVTRKDKWCYFLKNLINFDQIPSIFREPIFEQAFATAEVARMNRDELSQYDANLMIYNTNFAVMETAIEEATEKAMAEGVAKGMAEGVAKGMAEGRTAEKIEIARNMKEKGLDTVLIAEMTDLSPEEIEQIRW